MNNLNLSFYPFNVPGIIAAKVWIKGGSKEDPDKQKGGHQLLASVINRGCGPYSNLELADLVEGCGAGLRCDAYEDGILISLKCSNKDIDDLLPILAWMITDPHLSAKQIDLERELTIQALNRQKENPFQIAFDGWREIAYGNGPYGHDPLGLIKDLRKITRNDLINISNRLKKQEKFLVIAGTLPNRLENKIFDMKPFEGLINNKNKVSKEVKSDYSMENKTINSARITLQPQRTEQVVLMLGKPTIPHGHKDDIALRLLSSHLGSGMSSLLFRELREKHGVSYDVGIHHPTRERESPFLIHVSTTKDKAALTLNLLLGIWENMQKVALSFEEIKLARAKFGGQISHNSQTISQIAERRAQLKGLGLRDDYDEFSLKASEKITSKDIQATAIKYLKDPILSLCGPMESIKLLERIWNDS